MNQIKLFNKSKQRERDEKYVEDYESQDANIDIKNLINESDLVFQFIIDVHYYFGFVCL